ncbi:MAG: hypothetical protein NVS9B7_14580 [Flavisolibacter sp.]
MAEEYKIQNIFIYESFAENIGFANDSFDVVYVRQAMHHANNLLKFVNECSRVLKPGGLFITIRDHVIIDEEDKRWFLDSHPLHKFYGGENAFTEIEYTEAMTRSNLDVKKIIRFFDSEVNFFPISSKEIKSAKIKHKIYQFLISMLPNQISGYFKKKSNSMLKEENFPGRMYSFIAIKK